MNISLQRGSAALGRMPAALAGGGLKSTQEKLERQAKCASQVEFFEQQKENLKQMECDTVEEIARKLELFHSYEDQIAAVKASYNNEQMWHVLDEAREQGEKIAEKAEEMAPKTEEERKEDQVEEAIEEATGAEDQDSMLEDLLDTVDEITEELVEETIEELENVSEEELAKLQAQGVEGLTEEELAKLQAQGAEGLTAEEWMQVRRQMKAVKQEEVTAGELTEAENLALQAKETAQQAADAVVAAAGKNNAAEPVDAAAWKAWQRQQQKMALQRLQREEIDRGMDLRV